MILHPCDCHLLFSFFATIIFSTNCFLFCLGRCEFIGTNLNGAVLAGAKLESANLQGTSLDIECDVFFPYSKALYLWELM